jgi:outer membrane protein assembly factor BamB/predicted Ser/Thr protein kinase
MGRVYLGQSRAGRRLAIKLLSEQYAEDPEYRERFAREVAAARLVSPLYTAAVVDADPRAKNPWLATTFIDGPSLEEWVEKHGPLPADKVLALAAGLAEALSSIHKVGLVHRDLKPPNVIINPNGPHIIDFGIALAGDDTRITTSLMVGTPSYMAPERVNGLDAGSAGDIFSLGATLFYAATGSQLVSGGSFYEQIVQVALGQFDLSPVPKECQSVIELCLRQAPQERPTSEELIQVLVGMGVQQPETGWWPELEVATLAAVPPKGPTRRRLLVAASGIGVLLAGGGATALAYRMRPRASTPAVDPSPSNPSSAAQIPPREKSRVLWELGSGADSRPGTPDSSAARVIVDRGARVISASGPEVTALDPTDRRVWTRALPVTAVRLRAWGDAVLAGDQRRLWLLDAATGDQRFDVNVAAAEEAYTRDNPDRMTVQIQRLLIAEDRALVGLGTATVAIDRAGQFMWRAVRPFDEYGHRTPPPIPMVANGTHVVSRETGVSPRLVSRQMSNGKIVWSVPDTFSKQPGQNPPPPGGEGADEAWQRAEGWFAGGNVVLRDGPEVQVRSVANGKLLWHSLSQTPVAGIQIFGETVLISADRLIARRIDTGEQVWELPVRGARVGVLGDSFVAAHEGELSMVDAGGKQRWHEQFPPSVRDAGIDRLTVHEQTVFVTFRRRGNGPGGGGPGGGGPGGGGPGPGPRPSAGTLKPIDVVAFRLTPDPR